MLTTTYHCFKCNKCIDFYAAHSKWHNNCIGKKNYRLFVTSSSCAALLCGLIIEAVITLLISYFANYQTMNQWLDFQEKKAQLPLDKVDEGNSDHEYWLTVFIPVPDEIWMGTLFIALSFASYLVCYIILQLAPFCVCSCKIKHAQLLNFAVDIPTHHPLKTNQFSSLLLQDVSTDGSKPTFLPEKIFHHRNESKKKHTRVKEPILQLLNSPSTSSQHIRFIDQELPSKSRFIGLLEYDNVISPEVILSSSSETFSQVEIAEPQDHKYLDSYEDDTMMKDTVKRHKLENRAWSPVSETDLSPNRVVKFRPTISPGISSLKSSASDRTLKSKKIDSSRASSPKSIFSSPPRKELLNRERCMSP